MDSSRWSKTCNCGESTVLKWSTTEANPDRRFWGCHNWRSKDCKFFQWFDENKTEGSSSAKSTKRLRAPGSSRSEPTSFNGSELKEIRVEISLMKENVAQLVFEVKVALKMFSFLCIFVGFVVGFLLGRM